MPTMIPVHKRSGVVAHAIVDDEDVAVVGEHRWYLLPNGYAATGITLSPNNQRRFRMHRMILRMGRWSDEPLAIHHRNGDKLDNRRANLAVVDRGDHLRIHAQGRTGRLSGPPYRARVMYRGVRYFLGTHSTESEARRAVAEWRRANGVPVEVV